MAVRYVIDTRACGIKTAVECFSLHGRTYHVAQALLFRAHHELPLPAFKFSQIPAFFALSALP
jgi:hypothetical protein